MCWKHYSFPAGVVLNLLPSASQWQMYGLLLAFSSILLTHPLAPHCLNYHWLVKSFWIKKHLSSSFHFFEIVCLFWSLETPNEFESQVDFCDVVTTLIKKNALKAIRLSFFCSVITTQYTSVRQRFYTYIVRFILKYFILFNVIVKGICFLISFLIVVGIESIIDFVSCIIQFCWTRWLGMFC